MMFRPMRALVAVVMLSASLGLPSAAATPSQAEVNETLRNSPDIYNGLFTAALIRHIVKVCPAIEPPGRLRRVSYFLSLYNRARAMGYSRGQIEAFVEDKGEQARMQSLVDNHLRRAGAGPSDRDAVCAYARGEIAAQTALGRQLREN